MGNLFWGSNDDLVNDIEIDKDGNIVIAGVTYSSSGIATASANQPMLIGTTDGFISKFTPAGAIVWSTYLGYNGGDEIQSISTDGSGTIYVTGSSTSTVTLSLSVHQPVNNGSNDAFIAKLSSTGVALWATYYGGTGSDYGKGICVDANKNCYIIGSTTSSSAIATLGSYQPTFANAQDGFLIKFDSTGKRVFGTYYGGTGTDDLWDLNLGLDGKLIISGYTNSNTGMTTTGSYQPTYGGGSFDGLISKFDTSGSLVWSTYFGGTGIDYLFSTAIDKSGNICAIGKSNTSGLATTGAFQTTNAGLYDALLVNFTNAGTLNWASYFGGVSPETGDEIAIDQGGNIFFSGATQSSSAIATAGAFQTTLGGMQDAFLAKYGNNPTSSSIKNNIISSGQGLCLGNAANVITGGIPSGGDGTFSYKWLSSNTGATGSFIDAALPNTFDTYSPGAIGINTYYKRIVFSGTDSDTSNTCAIIVSNDITSGFTVNKTIQCAKGNQFIFTDTTKTSTGVLFHYWDFGNGVTSTKAIDTISYIQSADNVFKIKLITLLNGGCGDTLFRNVFLINNPLPKSITGKDTVNKGSTETYTVPTTTGSTFNWVKSNGTGNSLQSSINIKWTQLGNTQLKMVEQSGGGCWGDTITKNIYVKSSLGGDEELQFQLIKIYPNPTNGVLNIEMETADLYQVKLFNQTGELLIDTQINNSTILDLEGNQNGLYILEITYINTGYQIHKKVLKD